MVEKRDKSFDCIEMKRKIQEQIYRQTRGMTAEELLRYYHERVANSRFVRYFPELAQQSSEG